MIAEVLLAAIVMCFLIDLLLFHSLLRRKDLTTYEYIMLQR